METAPTKKAKLDYSDKLLQLIGEFGGDYSILPLSSKVSAKLGGTAKVHRDVHRSRELMALHEAIKQKDWKEQGCELSTISYPEDGWVGCPRRRRRKFARQK